MQKKTRNQLTPVPYPCRSQFPTTPILRSLTNTCPNVSPHIPLGIMLLNLTPEFEPKPCKTYPLLPVKQVELNVFLDENLAKGYIRPSKSPMASPFFFVEKKDRKLCPVQDYCKLNKGTIKNQYPLPLIPEVINKLKGTRIFSKIDLYWGYNNV